MIEQFNIESNDNTFFVTSQCNNRCLMCCQPPSKIDDIDLNFARNLSILKDAPTGISEIGISGGEPTLLGDRLPFFIRKIREKYPQAHIHILSNGRAFKDYAYAKLVKEAAGENLTIGVPLHSDYEKDHDCIAGVQGAYEETMHGIYNLYNCDVNIELRVVINKLNYKRLYQMSEFIFKNLPFVSWVAFMSMEDIGYTIKNREIIWCEPIDYAEELAKAVLNLAEWNVDVSIYNVPLCLLRNSVWEYARKSISYWKNKYVSCCDGCAVKERCCGLFATSKHIYNGIKKVQ